MGDHLFKCFQYLSGDVFHWQFIATGRNIFLVDIFRAVSLRFKLSDVNCISCWNVLEIKLLFINIFYLLSFFPPHGELPDAPVPSMSCYKHYRKRNKRKERRKKLDDETTEYVEERVLKKREHPSCWHTVGSLCFLSSASNTLKEKRALQGNWQTLMATERERKLRVQWFSIWGEWIFKYV